jgi:phosphatidylglycerophosphate synthase
MAASPGVQTILTKEQRRAHSMAFALTVLRLALAPVIILLAIVNAPGMLLAAVVLLAGVSDLFDGVILRGADVVGTQLRRLDSVADTVFYLAVATVALLRYRAVLDANALLIVIVLVLQVAGHALEVSRFGRTASYHAWSGRLWGWTIAIAFLVLFAFGETRVLTLALVCGLISQLENIAITLVLPEWHHDVKSVYHAARLRRAEN